MQKKIVIIGAGFAGLWSALAAARRIAMADGGKDAVEITLVAPEPTLVMRPRLYEAEPQSMFTSLGRLFDQTGIRYVQGRVESIWTVDDELEIIDAQGVRSTLSYDRLILAAGSQASRPNVPGLREFAFSADQLDEASTLDEHMRSLAGRPASNGRDTVVVVGGGFTGIEMAAELPARMASILGPEANVRVIIVEREDEIGPEIGPGPRPIICQALSEIGVEIRVSTTVTAIDASGLTIEGGEQIESATVIWTAGMRANPLTDQVQGDRDAFGRIRVDRNLRAPGAPRVFVAGDAGVAETDNDGNHTLMSCQHAMNLGRSAGDNAVADLLGLPLRPYSQPGYITCLDLGPWGAVVTRGWDRQVWLTGADAKKLKRKINCELIYLPSDPDKALALADPAFTHSL